MESMSMFMLHTSILNTFHLFETDTETERDRQTVETPICWLIPQVPAMARTGDRPKQEAGETTQFSHMGSRYAATWAITCCFSGDAWARYQEQSQDSNPDTSIRDVDIQWAR